jgi:hypothetical protein
MLGGMEQSIGKEEGLHGTVDYLLHNLTRYGSETNWPVVGWGMTITILVYGMDNRLFPGGRKMTRSEGRCKQDSVRKNEDKRTLFKNPSGPCDPPGSQGDSNCSTLLVEKDTWVREVVA